jgi:MFS family permease/SepF-like predicted cell division protein (DUF552 family)
MDNTQFKVDEPRRHECEAYRVVLQEGERSIVKSGEIKVIRLGGPRIYVREPGKAMEAAAPKAPIAVASRKPVEGVSRTAFRPEKGWKASADASRPERGGVRVIDLRKEGEKTLGKDPKAKKVDGSKVKEEKSLRKDLDNSIAEGSFTTASSSIISSYSTPFALALNATNSEIGLLNSVQNLAGILSQLPGARLTRSMTRKKIWVMCTLLSRLALMPIIFIGFFAPSTEIWILIALLGMVSFFSTMRGPAWSSLMGDIVPQDRRGRYFGKRNMVIGAAGMVTILAAGGVVFYLGFPLIFMIAVILSLASIVFFVRMREPELRQDRAYHYHAHFRPADLASQIRTNRSFAVFTVYMTVVNFGVNIAAPFAAVYMLKDLDVGYGWFAILVTIGALVQMLSMRYWGNNCDKYGNRKILVISGVLICFVPLGYMLSTNVLHLIILKVYDGFVWGAFDLVVFNYLLAVTPAEKRPGFVANFNFMSGSGTVAGALLGGVLAAQFASGGFMLLTSLQAIFLISLILRLCSVPFLPKISEVEVKECLPVRYVFWETVAIGPAKGMEHAITSAFRYPYGVKIKCALGLNNSKKIRISKKDFRSGEHDKQKVFSHLGVSPIEASSKRIWVPGGVNMKKGVFQMALGERHKSSGNAEEYMELGVERMSPKTARIIVHSLQRFSETDRIVKSIKARNIVFVGLKSMKQSNLDELKQSVAKINRACSESGSSMSLVDEEWLIVTPQTAALV